MILTKLCYTDLEELLENNSSDAGDKLTNIQEEFLYKSMNLYANGKKEEIDKELRLFKRFHKMLLNYVSHSLSYQVGIFTGVFQAVEFLMNYLTTMRKKEIKLEALFEKEINKKILFYLHTHPSSQHKVIAEAIGVQVNYLSQQMRELEKAGGIVRYGVDRRSFYELTLDGQAFVQKKEKQKSECAYFDRIFEEIGQEDKWEMGLSDPEDEFMNCVENTYWPEKFLYGNREKLALQKILT
ncbi:winged helix-turn-helix transcriptional regulator [Clostridiaceae bacterium]|jgi:hypothetical protein|nr:winged helix-turn-helix transcriptional regulator [Lachnospiraceae bacterium]NBH18953.1 winged helix-turn-helix transcriptional regulator [Clostridiaceae bacterium]